MQETTHLLDWAVGALRGIEHAPVGIENNKDPSPPFASPKIDVWRAGPAIEPTLKRLRRSKACPAPSRYFTGREAELQQMVDYFDGVKQGQHIFVLHGLGGGGKTQTALKFVNRYQSEGPNRRQVPFSFHSFQCLHAFQLF